MGFGQNPSERGWTGSEGCHNNWMRNLIRCGSDIDISLTTIPSFQLLPPIRSTPPAGASQLFYFWVFVLCKLAPFLLLDFFVGSSWVAPESCPTRRQCPHQFAVPQVGLSLFDCILCPPLPPGPYLNASRGDWSPCTVQQHLSCPADHKLLCQTTKGHLQLVVSPVQGDAAEASC